MKKLFAILLSLLLLVGMLPMTAFADSQSVNISASYNTTVNKGGTNYVSVVSTSTTKDGYKLVIIPQDESIKVKSGLSGVITSTASKTTIYEIQATNTAVIGQHKLRVYAISTEISADGAALDKAATEAAITSNADLVNEKGKILQAYEIGVLVVDNQSSTYTGNTAAMTVDYLLSGGEYIYADEINTLTLSFYNRGNVGLRNAELSISLPTGMTIRNGSDSMYVGTVNINKTATAAFPIICDDTVKDGSYKITATLKGSYVVYSYDSDGNITSYENKTETLTQSFYVPVKNGKAAAETSDYATPRLMVSNYSCGGSIIAGKTFGLSLTILNTSKVTLQNIKVTVTPSVEGMVPVGTSNSYFIESLAPGETVTRGMNFSTGRETVQGYYALAVDMNYEDTNKSTYSSSDKVSVSVIQESRLVVDDIVDPGWLTMSDQGYCSVNYRNMGNNDIKNLQIYIEGDFTMETAATYFVGTLASGKQDYYNFNFYPNQAGPMNGRLTFTYEDADGEEHYLYKEFTFNIGEGYTPDDPGVIDEPVKTGFHMPVWGWIIVAVVVIAVVIIIVKASKKKKAKKEEELDLDE